MYPARDVILTELSMLDEMLQHTGPEQVIERESLQARKQKVQAELDALPPSRPLVSLTFKGDPVEGQRAIQADFGGKAAELFSGVVATVGAAVDAPLHNSGPIRGSRERQLRIVGTAQGSFGFEQEVRLAIGGVFPSQRRFEAHLDGTVIHGDLGPDLSADAVQAAVGTEVSAKLHVRAFRQSKRYTLLELLG